MLTEWHRALFVVILVLPFLGQSIPYPGGVPLFLPVAALLVIATLMLRVATTGGRNILIGDLTFMVIAAIILLSYLYGIILSTDFPVGTLLREAATGIVAMLVVFTIANAEWTGPERDNVVMSAAKAILFIGVFVGAIGAWKFWQFVSSGEMFGFVLDASSGGYPWGTSLVSDYNFYALTILAAILSGMFLCSGRSAATQIALGTMITGLIVVGFLAGSRRFWVVAPLLIAAQIAWMIYRRGIKSNTAFLGTIIVLLAVVPAGVLVSMDASLADVMTSGWDFQHRMRSLFDSETAFGMGSRFELWQFATRRLEGVTPWLGSGFDYMRLFSCKFGDCSGVGYPHMPFLSAYLYGGVMAGIAVIALYAYTFYAALRLTALGTAAGWLIFPMLAAFLFAAVSSNGPYSIRSYIVLGALCVGLLWAEQRDAFQSRHSARAQSMEAKS